MVIPTPGPLPWAPPACEVITTWISQREPRSFLEAALCCMGHSKESPRNVIWAVWQQGGPVSVNWTPNLSSEAYLLIVHKGCVWGTTDSSCQNPIELYYRFPPQKKNHYTHAVSVLIVHCLWYSIIQVLQVCLDSLVTKVMQQMEPPSLEKQLYKSQKIITVF